jgi:hypothetical protein
MSDRSGKQTVILTTNWWWQKLGRDWQWINKECTDFKSIGSNLKKLNEAESKGQNRIEISNRFAVLENLRAEVVINRTKESLGYYELKKHKPWFDEGCSKL